MCGAIVARMDDSARTVIDAWRVVVDDLADLGRRAVTGARNAAADQPADADPLGRQASAARGAMGELGTSLADEGRAALIGREVEAAVKVSLDGAGAMLAAAARRLRSLDDA